MYKLFGVNRKVEYAARYTRIEGVFDEPSMILKLSLPKKPVGR